METLGVVLARSIPSSATTFEEMSPKDFEQFKVDSLNESEGNEHERDGYTCSECKNKGYIAVLVENNGHYTHALRDCKCAEIRRSILRMKKSGLGDVKKFKFENFEDEQVWQQQIKIAAMAYAHKPEGWFYLGGQSGSGKTFLCTAICRVFLYAGKRVQYMMWRDDIAKLKGMAMEPEERQALIEKFKCAEVLYIDDLFKTGKSPDGETLRPTAADVTTAFEILNYRYNNPKLLTIISSEWSEDELLDIDEATGGRILERAKTISIAKDRSRNYRMRKAVTV